MTFFQKFRCQIGPPTLRAMGIPRTPPESRLARWALGAARYDPTCDLCKVRICRYNYAVIHDAHQAKRDSGGVRGIPIALSVGGPNWHRNFWKKVIRNPIADIGFFVPTGDLDGAVFCASPNECAREMYRAPGRGIRVRTA